MKKETYTESIQEKEEVIQRPISFKSSFWVVFAIHLFGGIGLLSFTGGTKTANAEDKKFLESKESQFVGVEQPTPTPTPVAQPKQSPKDHWPTKGKPKVVAIVKTKEYVVKKGDNLYAISKKYKLDFEKLKQLNNIKDPSKIYVGQKLKFM
jgi:LysM repeat protein